METIIRIFLTILMITGAYVFLKYRDKQKRDPSRRRATDQEDDEFTMIKRQKFQDDFVAFFDKNKNRHL